MSSSDWNAWRTEWATCTKCPIGKIAYRHVLGVGPENAKLLLIGEGPGKSEDTLGLPFIGRAGKLLDRMLDAIGIDRATVFITNLIACRATDGLAADNRKPTPQEVMNCRPRLLRLLELLQPKGIMLIGRPAQWHGQIMLRQVKWRGPLLFVTHPAAFLRNGGVNAPGYERTVHSMKDFWEKYIKHETD